MTANRADHPLRNQPPNELSHLPRQRTLPSPTRCATPKRCCHHAGGPLAAATTHFANRLLARPQFAAGQPNVVRMSGGRAPLFSSLPRAVRSMRWFDRAAEPLAPAHRHAAGFVYLWRDFNVFLFGPFPCMPNDQCDKHSFYNCIQQGVGGDLPCKEGGS